MMKSLFLVMFWTIKIYRFVNRMTLTLLQYIINGLSEKTKFCFHAVGIDRFPKIWHYFERVWDEFGIRGLILGMLGQP